MPICTAWERRSGGGERYTGELPKPGPGGQRKMMSRCESKDRNMGLSYKPSLATTGMLVLWNILQRDTRKYNYSPRPRFLLDQDFEIISFGCKRLAPPPRPSLIQAVFNFYLGVEVLTAECVHPRRLHATIHTGSHIHRHIHVHRLRHRHTETA
jgi:hypothetical protein